MWILPKNYQLSSPYVQDMVESKEDLTLQELNIESSLMWRSKPSPLRTWLPRWKRIKWMPHLCGRILKPCQWSHFETELTSSLAVIPANLLAPLEIDLEKKTPDTSGPTSATSSEQLDLFDVSLKMSKDTSVLDSEKSLATWKALVIKRRGEYSQRVKSALLIRESESTSWGTPAVNDANKTPHCEINSLQAGLSRSVGRAEADWPTPRVSSVNGPSQKEIELGNPKKRLETEVIVREPAQWATPMARDWKGGIHGVERGWSANLNDQIAERGAWPTPTVHGNYNQKGMSKTSGDGLATAVKMWPTPTVQDSDKATKKMRDNHQNNLTAIVFDQEMLPTPTTRDWKGGYKENALTRKDGKSRRFDALPNAAIGGVGVDIVSGHLNPDWVEWLMGVPTGWTGLDSWETE